MGMDFFVMRVGSFGTYQRRIFVLLCLAAIPAGIKNTGPAFWANPSLPLCAPSREDADDITVNGTARQSSDLPPHDSHPSSTPNSSGINSTIATSIEINTLVYNRRTSQDVANQPMVLSSLLHQKCFISENETSWLVTNNGTTQQCRKSEAAFSTIVGRVSSINLIPLEQTPPVYVMHQRMLGVHWFLLQSDQVLCAEQSDPFHELDAPSGYVDRFMSLREWTQ